MGKLTLRIPKELKQMRDDLVIQIWVTRRFTMEQIAKIFRLDTTQIFFKTRKRHYVIIDAPATWNSSRT